MRGNMASTQSKLSHRSGGRPASQTRLVAAKPAKAAKLSVAGKSNRPTAPASIGRTGRFPKPKSTPPPAIAKLPDRDPKSELKAQFAKLSSAVSQIASFKRSLPKTFFEVGELLGQIRNERLYEVKGYGSFESFVEREIDINKVICMKTVRIAEVLNREAALAAGLDRASAAVAALDGEASEGSTFVRPASLVGGVPLHKQ
jgi:hypothetical protein